MDGFFKASRVAVIGVSPRPGNLGQRIIRNLQNFDFQGQIIPVGPRGGVVYGFSIYKDVREVPGKVDLAVILTPAVTIPDLMEGCGEKGIRRVVIESGGFAEYDETGRELSDRVLAIARKYGIRIIGPNGIGVANCHNGLAVAFATLPKPRVGGTSIITQSGGVGIGICEKFMAEHLGMAKFTSMGNKIDVNEAELIRYLAKDPQTNTIVAYLESIADGRALFNAARGCTKPLVVHKSNVGETSRRIAASHSSAILSDDRIVEAMFHQAGILRARSQYQLIAAAKAFTLPVMKGDRLAILSRSGGHAVIAADQCHRYGLKLPAFSDKILHEVKSHLRAGVIKLQNPMDLGDLFDMEVYQLILEKIVSQKNVDGVLLLFSYHSNYDPHVPQRIVDLLQVLSAKYDKPIVLSLDTWAVETRRMKEYSAFPIFDSPEDAVWALAKSRQHFMRLKSKNSNPSRPRGIRKNQVADFLNRTVRKAPVTLNADSFRVLRRYGIACPAPTVAKTAEAAAKAAAKIGYPVVLKVESAELTHKTDRGGVALNVGSSREVKKIVRRWRKAFGAALTGVLVQPMATDGPELILGGKLDVQFGPVILLGWGGVLAELMDRPVIRLAPITFATAREMVASLPAQHVLDGYRGGPPISKKAIADALYRLGWLVADNPQIAELDINPLRAYPDGVSALDARIILEGAVHKR